MNTAEKRVLDHIRIAAPCDMPWEDMAGDERSRYCAKCELNVFNISEMTREEAETFLREKAGKRVCGRIYRRKDGTILTKNCPSGVGQIRRKRFFAAAAVALLFAGISSAFGGMGLKNRGKNDGWFASKLDSLSHRITWLNACNCSPIIMGDISYDMGVMIEADPEMGEIEPAEDPETPSQ